MRWVFFYWSQSFSVLSCCQAGFYSVLLSPSRHRLTIISNSNPERGVSIVFYWDSLVWITRFYKIEKQEYEPVTSSSWPSKNFPNYDLRQFNGTLLDFLQSRALTVSRKHSKSVCRSRLEVSFYYDFSKLPHRLP